MVDEDWRTGTTVDDLEYGRSVSTATLRARWDGRIEQTLNWHGLRFIGGGRVIYTAWDAAGGTYYYSYVDAGVGHGQYEVGTLPSETAISYQQTWFMPYLGIENTWSGSDSSVTVTLRGFPWTICWDVDDHKLRDITFNDILRGGWYGQGSVEVALPGEWQWGLRLSGELAYGAVGDTFETDSGGGTYSSANTAGAWFREFSVAFFVRN
jgi:outer membrane protease